MIRAPSNEAAASRLQESWRKYYLEGLGDISRVTVLAGDCSKPLFGLSQSDYDYLSTQVSTIYHSAAEVNHVLPYSSLRKSNVVATYEILKFAAYGTNKNLNYVSTLGAVVFGDMQLDTVMMNRLGGYNTTKIVSEQILMRARANGFRVNIFRPGK